MTAWASCSRSPTGSSQRRPGSWASTWAAARDYGVGMFFFPQDTLRRNQAKKMFEVIVAKEGMKFLGWRKVPVCPEMLGQKALAKMPYIEQAFVERPADAAPGTGLRPAGSMWPAGCSSSPTTTPMSPPCPAAPSSIRECSWWVSCGSSTRTCRVADYRVRHGHGPLPLLHQHQPLLGAGPPQPPYRSTTARSTPSGAMRTGCWPGRRPCPPACMERRHGQGAPGGQRRRLRLRHAGQHPGIPDDERHGPAAGGDGLHPGALDARTRTCPGPSGICTSTTPP